MAGGMTVEMAEENARAFREGIATVGAILTADARAISPAHGAGSIRSVSRPSS